MRWLLATCLIMLLGDSSGARERHNERRMTYLALGDSYTIGEGVQPADRWPVQLAGLLRKKGFEVADPDIVATTGWTTAELATGITEWQGSRSSGASYDVVSLLIGVNNQYRGQSLEVYRTELRSLIKTAVDFAGNRKSRVFMLSIPDYGITPFAKERDPQEIARELDEFNAAASEVAKEEGVAFIEITADTRKLGGGAVVDDGLHPSGAVYKLWAEKALPVALKALEER